MRDGHGHSAPGKPQAYPDAGLNRFFVETGGKVSVVLSDALRRVLPLKIVCGPFSPDIGQEHLCR